MSSDREAGRAIGINPALFHNFACAMCWGTGETAETIEHKEGCNHGAVAKIKGAEPSPRVQTFAEWVAEFRGRPHLSAGLILDCLAAVHDARVTELLEANNREVEHRRQVERRHAITEREASMWAERCERVEASAARRGIKL